jgi:hypothetical protein
LVGLQIHFRLGRRAETDWPQIWIKIRLRVLVIFFFFWFTRLYMTLNDYYEQERGTQVVRLLRSRFTVRNVCIISPDW